MRGKSTSRSETVSRRTVLAAGSTTARVVRGVPEGPGVIPDGLVDLRGPRMAITPRRPGRRRFAVEGVGPCPRARPGGADPTVDRMEPRGVPVLTRRGLAGVLRGERGARQRQRDHHGQDQRGDTAAVVGEEGIRRRVDQRPGAHHRERGDGGDLDELHRLTPGDRAVHEDRGQDQGDQRGHADGAGTDTGGGGRLRARRGVVRVGGEGVERPAAAPRMQALVEGRLCLRRPAGVGGGGHRVGGGPWPTAFSTGCARTPPSCTTGHRRHTTVASASCSSAGPLDSSRTPVDPQALTP